jgi:hypothetical protein
LEKLPSPNLFFWLMKKRTPVIKFVVPGIDGKDAMNLLFLKLIEDVALCISPAVPHTQAHCTHSAVLMH